MTKLRRQNQHTLCLCCIFFSSLVSVLLLFGTWHAWMERMTDTCTEMDTYALGPAGANGTTQGHVRYWCERA